MSLINQELDQLSTIFNQSIGIAGDNLLPEVDSEHAETIGDSRCQVSSSSAEPLDNQSSSSSASSETVSSGCADLPGCTGSSLRQHNPSNGSTNGSSNSNDSRSTNSTLFSTFQIKLPSVKEYDMNHAKRGLCLIFNHEEFEHVSPRTGTEHDAYCLKRSFEYLGFDVKRYDNLSHTEITETLHEVSRSDHSNADCFCCCILTHGEGEDLHARDRSYAKHSIFDFFTGENCPTLAGKPKIFFIQACRGTKVDYGVSVDCQRDAVQSSVPIVKEPQLLPVMADFLISYSTVENYYSYRNVNSGGWFVQALTPLLEELADQLDLNSILTLVNEKVAVDFGPQPGKQMPQVVHTFTKKLIFRRKPYCPRQLTRFIPGDREAQSINTTPTPGNNQANENC